MLKAEASFLVEDTTAQGFPNFFKREGGGEERERYIYIVNFNWCLRPSQPQRIISGLKETLIKRYTVERTNTAEIRPAEQ